MSVTQVTKPEEHWGIHLVPPEVLLLFQYYEDKRYLALKGVRIQLSSSISSELQITFNTRWDLSQGYAEVKFPLSTGLSVI